MIIYTVSAVYMILHRITAAFISRLTGDVINYPTDPAGSRNPTSSVMRL